MTRIPPGSGTIKREYKFSDCSRIDFRGGKPLRRMVGLPGVEEGANVGFSIRAIRIVDIGMIRHVIEILFVCVLITVFFGKWWGC